MRRVTLSFLSGKGITVGGLPNLQDSVAVVGFPIGGVNISVTAGKIFHPSFNWKALRLFTLAQREHLRLVCNLVGISKR